MPTPVQSLRVEPSGQGKAIVTGSSSAWVEAELPGIVLGAKEPRVLPRPRQGALDEPQRQGHAAGDSVAAVPQVVDDGSIAGEIVTCGDAVQVARASRVGRLTREHTVDRNQVVALRV